MEWSAEGAALSRTEGSWPMRMMGGERRDRSAELGDLARSVRDLITSDSQPEARAAYEAAASDLHRRQARAEQDEHDRSERRFKEA